MSDYASGSDDAPYRPSLSPDELDLIRRAGRPRSWKRGEILLREGEPGDSAILLDSGLAKITKSSDNGYTSLLAVRGPGEIVGEQSCLDGGFRSATVTAMRPVRGVLVPADRFRQLLEEHTPLMLTVARTLSARLRDTDRLRADHGARTASVRVARVLLGLAVAYGTDAAERRGARAIWVNQQELAGAAATSRETVVRTLGVLQHDGLVTTARGRTVVLDPGALERWADDA